MCVGQGCHGVKRTSCGRAGVEVESLRDIGRALRRATSVVYAAVGAEGGIAPRPRRRSRLALTTTEREEISRQLARGQSLRAISRMLRRAPSTLSREIARNGGRGVYRATVRRPAGLAAESSVRKPCRLATRPALRRAVAQKLAQQWSPQQITGWLRHTFPSDPDMQVSPETIYRSLFVQSRGVLKRAWSSTFAASITFDMRARAPGSVRDQARSSMLSRFGSGRRGRRIERCLVTGKAIYSKGARGTYVATLVERRSRYVHARSFAEQGNTDCRASTGAPHPPASASTHAIAHMGSGTELAAHRAFTIATDVQVYFCDPQSPWQRGSNENTNGLLRQYLPPRH